MGAFHWRNGIFFDRKPDGSVLIYRLHEAKCGTSSRTDQEDIALIPAAEWASIVSSSSKDGETGETFRAAYRFHTGADFDSKPAEPTPSAPTVPTPAPSPEPKKPEKAKRK